MDGGEDDTPHLMQALRIIEEAWGELRTTSYVQHQLGVIPARLPSALGWSTRAGTRLHARAQRYDRGRDSDRNAALLV